MLRWRDEKPKGRKNEAKVDRNSEYTNSREICRETRRSFFLYVAPTNAAFDEDEDLWNVQFKFLPNLFFIIH